MASTRCEKIAYVLCQSRKFGAETCAPVCMDWPGDVRKKPCSHAPRIFSELSQKIAAIED